MGWSALVAFALKRVWLVFLPVIPVLMLSIPLLRQSLTPNLSYTTAIRFTAAAPPDFTDVPSMALNYEDSAYVPWLASEYVVVNLPQWVTSDSFAQEVSAGLAQRGLTLSAEEVRPAFSADSARSILVVYITWDEAEALRLIAETAIDVLATRNQVYFPQFAAAPAQIVPLDVVRINTLSPSLAARLAPMLRLALAFIFGAALVLAWYWLDDSVRDEQDLAHLKSRLLGKIPVS
jgi:hypothetical protein